MRNKVEISSKTDSTDNMLPTSGSRSTLIFEWFIMFNQELNGEQTELMNIEIETYLKNYYESDPEVNNQFTIHWALSVSQQNKIVYKCSGLVSFDRGADTIPPPPPPPPGFINSSPFQLVGHGFMKISPLTQ